MTELKIAKSDDFEFLMKFLPMGWELKAKELGALRRCRKVPDAKALLRVLLIHLADGQSLRETSVLARKGGLVDLSDVAIMNRLRLSSEWFSWLNRELMNIWIRKRPVTVYDNKWNVKLVDGTRVKEPGPTGSSWCVHYSVNLATLRCDEFIIEGHRGKGETFKRFKIHSNDLLIGDRAYGTLPGIRHVLDNKGEVLVRFAWRNLQLWTSSKKKFDLFGHLKTLTANKIGDWPVFLKDADGTLVAGRVCAVKKSRQAAEKAQKQARRKAQKSGAKLCKETLVAAKYVFIFTTIKDVALAGSKALEIYRGRWQIEIVFKRLKSILSLGHLRKIDPRSARSWIQGKLLVAFLIEVLIGEGEKFFPWGYPIFEN